MSNFNATFNFTDSKIRAIIIATLSELQNKLQYKQFYDNNEFRIIEVPFYYSLTGSDDFLSDSFTDEEYSKFSDSKVNQIINKVPRGVINMTSVEIDAGSLVNRYIRCAIPKKVDDKTYKMYSYETIIIPLNLTFDATIICSSNIEMLKITEEIISKLYKVNAYFVDFGGYRVRASLNIPEGLNHEKLIEFGYSDKKIYNITFSIDVYSSILVFDEKSEMFLGNKMNSIDGAIYDMNVLIENDIWTNTENTYIDPIEKEKNKLDDLNI
jgi:hypothetical protein